MAPKNVNSSQPFVNALNAAFASGVLTFDLSQTANIIANGQVAPRRVSITLNASGICPTTAIWFNDQLNPAGTTYLMQLFDSGGNFAASFGPITLSGASVDLSTLTPVAGSPTVAFPGAVLLNPSAAQTITGFPLILPAGTAAAPSLGFIGDTQTGIYEGGLAGDIVFDSAGAPNFLLGNSVARLGSGYTFGWASATNPTAAATDTGLSRAAAAIVAIGNGTQGDTSGTLRVGNGSSAAPSISIGASGTGFSNNAGNLDLSFTGTRAITFGRPANGITVQSGSLFAWSSTSDPEAAADTGLSRSAAGTLAVGNGNQGDFSGTLKLSAIQGPGLQKQVFTSNGTFTIPTGITQVKVTAVGGGGGGGAAGGVNGDVASGGGAGGAAIKWLTGLTPGNTLNVTPGTSGAAGTGGGAGGSGVGSTVTSGTQTITSILTNGGIGGNGGTSAANTVVLGGAGATVGTGGDINFGGAGGGPALTATAAGIAGCGGNSILGGGGQASASSSTVAGQGLAGIFGGGGGGGAGNTGAGAANGGAGGAGIVIFEWVS